MEDALVFICERERVRVRKPACVWTYIFLRLVLFPLQTAISHTKSLSFRRAGTGRRQEMEMEEG